MRRIQRSTVGKRSLAAARILRLLMLSGVLAACAVDEPTSMRFPRDASLAKGGPGGVSVNSANPDSAHQGDVQVSVHVFGSGFAPGAKAKWSLSGDTTQVQTNSTTYVSSTEVVAVITVSSTATIASYDISVTNTDGKKGVGAELFAIQSSGVPVAITMEDSGPLGAYHVRSDGRGEYVNGVDLVYASIDGTGNLFMGSNGSPPATPLRGLTFDYSAPLDPRNTYHPDETGLFWRIVTSKVNTPRIQDLAVGVGGCYHLIIAHNAPVIATRDFFNPGVDPSANFAYITRTSATTWTVVSDGPCLGIANIAQVQTLDTTRNSSKWIVRGLYNQSFSMRLRAL